MTFNLIELIKLNCVGKYWISNVICEGNESEISKCRFDHWGKTNCDNSEAAGVICVEKNKENMNFKNDNNEKKIKIKDKHKRGIAIRLIGDYFPIQGQVEMKFHDSSKKY